MENFRPGTTERLGCGHDAVRAVRPDITGGPPAKAGIALNDIAGGVTAVQAILAAYIERDIQPVLGTDTTDHWVTAMLAGVPAGPVNAYDQMIADPHLNARGVTTTVEHSVLGPVRALSSAAGAVYGPALPRPAGQRKDRKERP